MSLKPEPNNSYAATTASKHGRCFVFKVENFLGKDELEKEFSEYFTSAQIQAFRYNKRIANGYLEEDFFKMLSRQKIHPCTSTKNY